MAKNYDFTFFLPKHMHDFQFMIKSCSNDLYQKTNDSDHHNQIYKITFYPKKKAKKNVAFWMKVKCMSNKVQINVKNIWH